MCNAIPYTIFLFVTLLSMPTNSPSILSGTDSAGLGGPLLNSFNTGDMTWFDVKSNNKSNNQKQSVDYDGKLNKRYMYKEYSRYITINI